MKSVAMAFYNGAKYIDEQIRSILDNMEDSDELVISVDDASDGSETILQNWAQNDPRIRIIRGPGKGVVKNFDGTVLTVKFQIGETKTFNYAICLEKQLLQIDEVTD